MSLSIAISNAMSGLGASSRGTEVVSTNIANKSVAGYARRELAVSSSALGGVTVDGVRRMVSAGLLADDRLAQAASAHSGAIASFHGAVETALQTEDEAGSIGSLVAGLDTALAAATSDPASAPSEADRAHPNMSMNPALMPSRRLDSGFDATARILSPSVERWSNR